MQRARQFLDHAEETFMAVSLAFMTILTFIQVVLREFGTLPTDFLPHDGHARRASYGLRISG